MFVLKKVEVLCFACCSVSFLSLGSGLVDDPPVASGVSR